MGFSLWGHRESDTTERLSHMDTCVASLVAQIVKNLPAMQEIWDQSLGWEDPWRREWPPTPIFLPGEFHGVRSLVGYSRWIHTELDMTEQLTLSLLSICVKDP